MPDTMPKLDLILLIFSLWNVRCCKGNTILLDSDQEGTYPDVVDTYQVKFRWYYEEGGPSINDYYWTFWWTENDNNEHGTVLLPNMSPLHCLA